MEVKANTCICKSDRDLLANKVRRLESEKKESTDAYFAKFAQWHHDRNIVNGSTNNAQFVKLLEEVIELYMCINPGVHPMTATLDVQSIVAGLYRDGRIKTEDDKSNLPDACGDINVVITSMAEREGFTMRQAFARSWSDIKDRKGEMRDGIWTKEEDL